MIYIIFTTIDGKLFEPLSWLITVELINLKAIKSVLFSGHP